MSGRTGKLREDEALRLETARVAVGAGAAIAEERRRRAWSLRALESASGVSKSHIAEIEAGHPASLETYVRLARALRLRPAFEFLERGRSASGRAEDPVHAAMGEIEAERLRQFGVEVGIDEPDHHYQFSGRADVLGRAPETNALLHIENRTRFPNVGETAGAFNSKRAYLGREVADRLGVRRWSSETHVIVALWSAEVLHSLRCRRATFASICRDPLDAFEGWWNGSPPADGVRSVLVVFDPLEGRRADRRRFAGLADIDEVRPRYRSYAEALAALKAAGRA